MSGKPLTREQLLPSVPVQPSVSRPASTRDSSTTQPATPMNTQRKQPTNIQGQQQTNVAGSHASQGQQLPNVLGQQQSSMAAPQRSNITGQQAPHVIQKQTSGSKELATDGTDWESDDEALRDVDKNMYGRTWPFGTRVRRGDNWKAEWDDHDGGQPGTVVAHQGEGNSYRVSEIFRVRKIWRNWH